MKVLGMLNELEEMIEGSKALFSNKASIDKGRALELITDIRIGLPDDFKHAEWISQERQRIIYDSEDEAKKILEQARADAEAMVEQDAITQKAYLKAKEILKQAEADAVELRNGAIFYSQDLMEKISEDMKSISQRVMKNHQDLEEMILSVPEEEEEETDE